MAKATKVPAMKTDQPFDAWKKELKIWILTNTTLNVDKKIQAGILFESLSGEPRETVLSELSVDQITAEDGVENIISTLDNFFGGNETKNAFSAMDGLMKYKRDPEMEIEGFVRQFQFKVNKARASGTILSDGVLGYMLLDCANLDEDKNAMVKATCDDMNYKTVKAQLEKIGIGKSSAKSLQFSSKSEVDHSKVKVESNFYSGTHRHFGQYSETSSDEDQMGERVYYSRKPNYRNSAENRNQELKLNPTDNFGFIRACRFCRCVYHWLSDCPYSPSNVKTGHKGNRNNSSYKKAL